MTVPGKEQTKSQSALHTAFSSRLMHAKLPSIKEHLIFWSIAIFGVAADLWTKSAVFASLEQDGSVPILNGLLRLVRTENPGAAFGIAMGQRYLLVAVSAIALLIILFLFVFVEIRPTIVYVALGLFAAGIVGNLYDRIFNDGMVRDFIDVVYWPGKHWPAFNIADAMLCVAVGLMMLSTCFSRERTR